MRKICTVVASRANYGRSKYLMKAIADHPDLELQLIVGASVMLERFGKAVEVIKKDGFSPNRQLYYIVEGETLATQAKSTGLGIIELATAFDDLKPDCVVTIADRFETMATAISATYMNIPLAHLQGGEISGNIDDRVRHAITKLSDVHFVASAESKDRVIRMGEDPETVFNFGDPAMDILKNEDLAISNKIMQPYGGVGSGVDWTKPYFLIVQHPVTTSYREGFAQISKTLEAVKSFTDYQKIVLWPNIDAGSDDVSKGIRIFREKNSADKFHYYRNFTPEDYARVLNNAKVAIGNSSSFLREGAFLGTPTVLVGDRQLGREHGRNIEIVDYSVDAIKTAIKRQVEHGRYPHDPIFGSGAAGRQIADVLSTIEFNKIKRIQY